MKTVLTIALLLTAVFAAAQRLPKTATPSNYKLHFTPDLKAATFDGDETIALDVAAPTTSIILNANEITFQQTTIAQNGKTQTGSVQLDPQKEFATITFPQQLAAGPATLHITYKGILNDKLRGFYLSKGTGRNYATTQFESTDARRAFPGFDEPAYKATFDISLTIDQGDTAISNGSIAKDTPAAAGKHTLTFTQTPKMSTYLVAMAVGDWKCSSGEQDGIPVRVCSTPDKVNLTGYALKSAQQILHFYNGYYGVKYPFHKLDVLAVPDFEAGAMENTAAIFYRESLLLIDDQHASVGAHQGVFDVLAHEMAHQWFGDLVTMAWWNDIWLNEGFATWMTYKPNEAVHPEWKGQIAETSQTANTLGIDSRKSTRAIRQQAETPDEINELFDAIAYQKAASVLRMVENFVGPEVFRKGVNAYLSQHAYANATAEDFWNAETAASGKPVDKIMKSFTEQPGAPLVSLNVECGGTNTVAGKQQRFFASKDQFGSAPNQTWSIPVCVQLKDGSSHCQIFDQKQASHTTGSCMQGAFFNANGRGYYRTQYDAASLKALNVPQLSPQDKIILLSDQWALARAGQESVGKFFDLADQLGNETDASVIGELVGPFQTSYFYLTTNEDKQQFSQFVERRFSPILERIGIERKPNEAPDVSELRADLLGILGYIARDQKVLDYAHSYAEKYLASPDSVDPNVAGTMLSLAALSNDVKLYDAYQQALQHPRTPEEFENLVSGLTSFTSPELVKRTIEFAASPAVRNQDAAFFFAEELGSSETRETAWPIIQQEWDVISKQLTMSSGAAVVSSAGSFCTPAARQQVEQFFTQHKVASAERTLKQSLERIDACVSFHNDQAPNLEQWLSSNTKSSQ